ncbi:MAG: polysaccharide biosynthesis/export family protein [Terriglobales bacterium]
MSLAIGCTAAAQQTAGGQPQSGDAPAASSASQQPSGNAGASEAPAASAPSSADQARSGAAQSVPEPPTQQPTTTSNPPSTEPHVSTPSVTPQAGASEDKKQPPSDSTNSAAPSKGQAAQAVTTDKTDAASAPGITPNSTEYTIGDGDMLAISVYKEPEVSRELTVRSDGKISLPLINGDIQATGLTPQQLQVQIVQKLRAVIEIPEVTVIVRESRSRSFIVLGQVMKPGTFPLNRPMTMLDAIAEAGGFQPFSNKKKITVLRKRADGTIEKFFFNYVKAVKTGDPVDNPAIQPGDKIVVPN